MNYPEWNHLAPENSFLAVGLQEFWWYSAIWKLSITKESKDKYDYINRHEIKLCW